MERHEQHNDHSYCYSGYIPPPSSSTSLTADSISLSPTHEVDLNGHAETVFQPIGAILIANSASMSPLDAVSTNGHAEATIQPFVMCGQLPVDAVEIIIPDLPCM